MGDGPRESYRLRRLMEQIRDESTKEKRGGQASNLKAMFGELSAIKNEVPPDSLIPVSVNRPQTTSILEKPSFETERVDGTKIADWKKEQKAKRLKRELNIVKTILVLLTAIGVIWELHEYLNPKVTVKVCHDNEATPQIDCGELIAGAYIGVLDERRKYPNLDYFGYSDEKGIAEIRVSRKHFMADLSVGIFGEEQDKFVVFDDGEKNFEIIYLGN